MSLLNEGAHSLEHLGNDAQTFQQSYDTSSSPTQGWEAAEWSREGTGFSVRWFETRFYHTLQDLTRPLPDPGLLIALRFLVGATV